MTGYQIDRAAVQAAVSHQSFTSAPLATWEPPTFEPAFTPTPEDVAEAAALFEQRAREAALEAVADASAAVAEVLAAFDDPLLGEHFEVWALEALDALDPADRLEATAADFEAQELAEAGVAVRPEGGAA